jgi:hypothetical protein
MKGVHSRSRFALEPVPIHEHFLIAKPAPQMDCNQWILADLSLFSDPHPYPHATQWLTTSLTSEVSQNVSKCRTRKRF